MQFWWHMVRREYWVQRVENAWRGRSIVWLAGVRRAGKTFLCQSLEGVEYFDCELPRVRQQLEDPEGFLRQLDGQRVVLDEVHRLSNPSELLKIAADHYPRTKVIATGSSTLGATHKFRDALTGRKTRIHLPPMLMHETADFDGKDLGHRLLHGGLPPFFIQDILPEEAYQEWLTSYWAKDVQELFRLERRHSFIKFTELMLSQSGSMFEASRFAAPCEVSRTTISNYLSVLEATFVAYVVRPFSSHAATEIVSAPKVYGFDTGFVCHCKGWHQLRPEDLGFLWEHVVLSELIGRLQDFRINYWRDKRGHEIDFVLSHRRQNPIAIECKWQSSRFEPSSLRIFRRRYPEGKNFVIAPDIDRAYTRSFDGVEVDFVPLTQFVDQLGETK